MRWMRMSQATMGPGWATARKKTKNAALCFADIEARMSHSILSLVLVLFDRLPPLCATLSPIHVRHRYSALAVISYGHPHKLSRLAPTYTWLCWAISNW